MIATTLEQSRKLVEIGIDPSTADMCWCNNSVKGVNYTDDYALHTHTLQELKELFDEALNGWDKYWEIVPTWSLSALLELMPRSITSEKNGQTYLSFHRGYEDKWMVEYSFDDIDRDYLEVKFEQRHPIDAAFEMIVWLKENKHI